MTQIICLISVIILAILTQHAISWAGSMLHQIGDTGQNYALFIFSDDRHQPMTNNILMNIFIPNIVSVFLYMIFRKYGISYIPIWVCLYVFFYFLYRFILICGILRRRELYTYKYECGMAVVALAICLLLNCFFFWKNKNLLMSVDDLKEELWFAVILIIYTFVKHILDNKVKQDDILTRRQLEKYIINQFEVLYKRYRSITDISREDRHAWIIIYAIMIFENFNRGGIFRRLERIKLKIVGRATVGIMQISSDKDLSDEESILEAYKKIMKYGKEKEIEFLNDIPRLLLNDLLLEYNRDENYASSVTYIYQCLCSFIYDKKQYSEDFMFGEFDRQINEESKADRTDIQCESIGEFVWKLGDNIELHMKHAKYNIFNEMEENENVRVDGGDDGWRVRLCNLSNFVIDGENSMFFSPFGKCTVLCFDHCYDFEIRNLVIKKEKTKENWEEIVQCTECNNISIKNVTLFGGIGFEESYNIQLENVCLQEAKQENTLIYTDSMINMENVEIFNCYTEGAIIDTCGEKLECKNVRIHDNQYRKNPNALSKVNGIIWNRNEQLPWL